MPPSEYQLISLVKMAHDNYYFLSYMLNDESDKDYIKLINYIGKMIVNNDGTYGLELIEDDNSYLQFKKVFRIAIINSFYEI